MYTRSSVTVPMSLSSPAAHRWLYHAHPVMPAMPSRLQTVASKLKGLESAATELTAVVPKLWSSRAQAGIIGISEHKSCMLAVLLEAGYV